MMMETITVAMGVLNFVKSKKDGIALEELHIQLLAKLFRLIFAWSSVVMDETWEHMNAMMQIT